jgi:hypothetical protein
MAGHWPIRLPDPDTAAASIEAPAADGAMSGRAGADDGVREADAVSEHLVALKKALKALNVVNRSLTRDVFARAAADPTHTLEYENIVQAIITETTEIRKKTQRAPTH